MEKFNPFSWTCIDSKSIDYTKGIIEKYGFDALDIDYSSFYFLFNCLWSNMSYELIDFIFQKKPRIYTIENDVDNPLVQRLVLSIDIDFDDIDNVEHEHKIQIDKALHIIHKMIENDDNQLLLKLPIISTKWQMHGNILRPHFSYDDNFKKYAKKIYHPSIVESIRNQTRKIKPLSQIVLKKIK